MELKLGLKGERNWVDEREGKRSIRKTVRDRRV